MTTAALREEHVAYLAKPWHWRALVRRASFSKQIKHVLCTLSDYAGKTGIDVRPGLALLAADSDSTYEQAQEAVALARSLGLLFLSKAGNRRRRIADEYWLIIHPDTFELADKHGVDFESPAARLVRAEGLRSGRRDQVSRHRVKKATGGQLSIDDSLPATPQIRGHQRPTNRKSLEGTSDPQINESEGTSDPLKPGLEGTSDPPTSFKERPRTEKTGPTDDQDLLADVTISRARDREKDPESVGGEAPKREPCPHGRSRRTNRRGEPRCENCRTGAPTTTKPATEPIPVPVVTRVSSFAKTKCREHGLPPATCTLCRRQLPGREAA